MTQRRPNQSRQLVPEPEAEAEVARVARRCFGVTVRRLVLPGNKMEYNLIMAVSRFPSLFDSSSVTYRDLNTRSDAWRQVAELVGVPGERPRAPGPGRWFRAPGSGLRAPDHG